MVIQFNSGQILFDTGQIAMDPACCCPECCMLVSLPSAGGCMGGSYNLSQDDATTWSCAAYNACFTSNPQTITLSLSAVSGTWYLTITVDGSTWQKSYVSKPDMCSIAGEVLSHVSSGACDTSGTTVTVTANSGPCPACGNGTCELTYCKGAMAADQVIVDLGAGGWVDGGCNYCDQVNGTYILDRDLSWVDECSAWSEEYGVVCTDAYGDSLYLTVTGNLISSAGLTIARVTVTLHSKGPYTVGTYSYAAFDSSSFSPCVDCFPRTCTKTTEWHSIVGTPSCSGTMPATVTIDAV